MAITNQPRNVDAAIRQVRGSLNLRVPQIIIIIIIIIMMMIIIITNPCATTVQYWKYSTRAGTSFKSATEDAAPRAKRMRMPKAVTAEDVRIA